VKSLFLLLFVFSSILPCNAQLKEGYSNPGYTVERNDPYSVPKFGLILYPFEIQRGNYGSFAISYGADIRWDVFSFFSLSANGFQSYGKGTLATLNPGNDPGSYQEIHAGGIIYFSNTEATRAQDINAWYKRRFKVIRNYLKDVDLKEISKFGIEGGWYSSRSIVVGNHTTLAGYMLNDLSKKVHNLNASSDIASLSSSNIYAGINWTTHADYRISFDRSDLETSDLPAIWNIYMDIIFPLNAAYSQMNVGENGNAPAGMYELNSNTSKSKNGFRFGWNLTVAKMPGISWPFELGRQPSIPRKAFYFLFKIGLGFHK
jgi:hypothetical protein